MTHFAKAAAATELTAYAPEIVALTSRITQAAGAALTEASFSTREFDAALERLKELRAELGAACRHDLGSETTGSGWGR